MHQRGSANAFYFVAVMVGSFLAPLAAGVQAAGQGWRWSYYALSIALTALFVVFVFLYEETKYVPPVTLGRGVETVLDQGSPEPRKKSKGIETDDIELLDYTQSNVTVANQGIRLTTYRERMRLLTPTPESLLRVAELPLRVVTLPHVAFTALQFASGVCWLVLYMSVSSVVFSAPPYNFDTAAVGYMTLGPFVGNIFGSLYGGPLADRAVLWLARRNGGLFEPEMRLYPLFLPVVTMAGGIVMFGVTADKVSRVSGTNNASRAESSLRVD